ncbi:protease inhibitor I42 family protein [Streptomyces spirodelae]|uniref:Protease inhibitor I42 family protein n=1 Tax=Streptomyces spirodelae TaxID=2812904 RepID=A0ABS3WR98_9ACTN|nr:protease inhibitor I42 family protein [Streptomyces spirodelae]MBO8185650.1 protease inhibitor I42 family protein [Streptomyces spirodelae]
MTRSRIRRTGPATGAAVALLLALSACGGADGTGGERSDGEPATASPAPASSGSASATPTASPTPDKVFDKKHTDVRVAPGDTFTLTMRINPSAGYDWQPVDPEPDTAVVVKTGQREKADSPDRMGSPGSLFLDYRAKAEGSAQVRLRKNCFRCDDEAEKSPEPDKKGPEVVFHITVKE